MNIVVLISGRGSNLDAICKADLAPHIKCVISSKPSALGLNIANTYNIPTHIITPQDYSNQTEFESILTQTLDKYAPDLIILAGFKHILSGNFVNNYTNKIINIHPSLLPAFIGNNAHTETLASGVKLSGVTIHYVTPHLDSGPIIAQGVVSIKPNDTKIDLSQRILELEHVLYPFVIKKILAQQVTLIDTKVIIQHDATDQQLLGDYISYVYY